MITDSGVKPFPAQELGDQLRRRDVVVGVDIPACDGKTATFGFHDIAIRIARNATTSPNCARTTTAPGPNQLATRARPEPGGGPGGRPRTAGLYLGHRSSCPSWQERGNPIHSWVRGGRHEVVQIAGPG